MPTPEKPQDNLQDAKAAMIAFALQHDRPTASHDKHYPADPNEGLTTRQDKIEVALLRGDYTLTAAAIDNMILNNGGDIPDPHKR